MELDEWLKLLAQFEILRIENERLRAKVERQEQRTLKKLKEPGKLSVRVREGWGFGGESFLADEIEMLEERVLELEKIKNIKCPYCARQYFLTPDGQEVADPYRVE